MNFFVKSSMLGCCLVLLNGCMVQAAKESVKTKTSAWTPEHIALILDKTLELQLAPDISHLSQIELETLAQLKSAGELIDEIYLLSRHKQALQIKSTLMQSSDQLSQDQLNLFTMFHGPIGTTLTNKRQPFVLADEEMPGKNVYPWGITKEEVDKHLEKHPNSKADILHLRTIVRRTTRNNLNRDLAVIKKYPVLDTLHLGLHDKLKVLKRSLKQGPGLYAVPYSVAYADRIIKVYHHVLKASYLIKQLDSDFSDYLRNRARDLLTDDYEAGDASWITGRFSNINAQIGSYETYDDALYGVKASFSMSILIKDKKRSQQLEEAINDLQSIENALPYTHQKTVKSEVPIGVYNVLADYAQSRGTNTASILPNENYISRKYGRTILLRYNIMTHKDIYAIAKASWIAVMAPEFKSHLNIRSNYERTLWHEIGHYLGPSIDKQGRTLDVALEDNSNLIEEMKSDLVSLFAHKLIHKNNRIDDAHLRMVYAGGVLRTLQKVKPRRSQSYQTMQLMTMNYFLEHGALSFDREQGLLNINYKQYPMAVEALLKKILEIQYQGDKGASDAFIEQYSVWDKNLHAVLAKKMRDTNQPYYRLVRYAHLGQEKTLR